MLNKLKERQTPHGFLLTEVETLKDECRVIQRYQGLECVRKREENRKRKDGRQLKYFS